MYLFLPGLGLRCSVCALSDVASGGHRLLAVRGLLLAVASSLFLFFFCRTQPPGRVGFSGCGAQACLPRSTWDLSSRPGIEPVSPALAGGYSTPGPPGKSQTFFFLTPTSSVLSWSSFLVSMHSTHFKCCKICKCGDVQWFDHSSGSFLIAMKIYTLLYSSWNTESV